MYKLATNRILHNALLSTGLINTNPNLQFGFAIETVPVYLRPTRCINISLRFAEHVHRQQSKPAHVVHC